jgi:hypothetical protein
VGSWANAHKEMVNANRNKIVLFMVRFFRGKTKTLPNSKVRKNSRWKKWLGF